MAFKPRILVLPLAAAVITAMVVYRYQRITHDAVVSALDEARQLAPRFELYDQHSQLVKFERYLGRTELFVVFFDQDQLTDDRSLLMRLRDQHDAAESADLQVVAVSLATPHAIREAERRTDKPFPFPVLTDIDMQSPIPAPVHRLWGLADDVSPDVRTGAFYVDRRGMVAAERGIPQPLHDPTDFLNRRLGSPSDH